MKARDLIRLQLIVKTVERHVGIVTVANEILTCHVTKISLGDVSDVDSTSQHSLWASWVDPETGF